MLANRTEGGVGSGVTEERRRGAKSESGVGDWKGFRVSSLGLSVPGRRPGGRSQGEETRTARTSTVKEPEV